MRWSDHLNAVYNETVGVAIGEDEPLAVLDLEYLRQLFGLLDVTENRVLCKFPFSSVGTLKWDLATLMDRYRSASYA